MKNNLFMYIFGVVICLSATIQARNVPAEKIQELKNYFASLKSGQEEYKKALRDYDTCVQKQCGQKIEALAKASENLMKANPFDFSLMKLLTKSREHAQAELDQCIADQCKDAREKLDFLTKQIQERSKILKRAILGAVGVLAIAGISAYVIPQVVAARREILQERREQEQREQVTNEMNRIIQKYRLPETRPNKTALRRFIIHPNKQGRPPYVPDGTTQSEDMAKALAEAWYGEVGAEFIINNPDSFNIFANSLVQSFED